MQDKLLNRNKFMWIFFIGIITLVGCVNQTKATKPDYIVSFNLLQDECNIADIVKDYNTLDYYKNSPHDPWAYFRKGEHAILRLMHEQRDKNLLKYIMKDPRFPLSKNCKSDFAMVIASGESYVPNDVQRYMLRKINSVELCRYNASPTFDFIRYDTPPVVKICINVETKKFTFEVLEKPLIEVLDKQSIELWKTVNNKPNLMKDRAPLGWKPPSDAK